MEGFSLICQKERALAIQRDNRHRRAQPGADAHRGRWRTADLIPGWLNVSARMMVPRFVAQRRNGALRPSPAQPSPGSFGARPELDGAAGESVGGCLWDRSAGGQARALCKVVSLAGPAGCWGMTGDDHDLVEAARRTRETQRNSGRSADRPRSALSRRSDARSVCHARSAVLYRRRLRPAS